MLIPPTPISPEKKTKDEKGVVNLGQTILVFREQVERSEHVFFQFAKLPHCFRQNKCLRRFLRTR